MGRSAIPSDTEAEVFDVLVALWSAMSVAERVAMVDQINADVELMAMTGIRALDPNLSHVEVLHQLAKRRFGAELADEAYRHQLA